MDGYRGGGDRHDGHPDSHRNSQSTMSSWTSDDYDRDCSDNHRPNFSTDAYHHQHQHNNHDHRNHNHRRHHHHHHHHRSHGEPNDPIGSGSSGVPDSGSSQDSTFSGRKRQLFPTTQGTSPDCTDVGNVVKLYIGAVPRTATEEDIRMVFGEYGNVVEVIFIKDKRTGQQQECCFVKYSKLEEADRAIGALHDHYTFPGGTIPVKVKYADGERERLGVAGGHMNKVYVNSLNKQASKKEIEEIFSPYGIIEDIYIVRDEMKQNRGSAFVKFLRREMAIAAINALHGTFVMRGCELPLIVRFAEPKKPRTGEMRPPPYVTDSLGQHMLSNDPVSSSPRQSTQIGSKPKLALSNCALDQVLPSAAPSVPIMPTYSEMDDSLDCDWSEHICPDGYKYYFNCVTFESRWEKPQEFILCEEQLEKLQHLQDPTHQQQRLSSLPAPAVTSPVLAPACV